MNASRGLLKKAGKAEKRITGEIFEEGFVFFFNVGVSGQ